MGISILRLIMSTYLKLIEGLQMVGIITVEAQSRPVPLHRIKSKKLKQPTLVCF
ncbi:hypothetical protein FIS3754_47330 [Fischerella sp. NIES-3754]|nr:hypothetical protein FIS3754_47330 [Fischerella sp. NIES-3754]BCX06245.1 MAG: hypothetical protein KatS3mg066_0104 [Fischerella sp.]